MSARCLRPSSSLPPPRLVSREPSAASGTRASPPTRPPPRHYQVPANPLLTPIDLTNKIVVTGVEAVVTTAPTPPSQPFVISYDVADNAQPPNKAQTIKRRVQV